MALGLRTRARAYSEPLMFVCIALYGGLLAIFDMAILRDRPQDLFSLSKLKDRVFGQFWLRMGPSFAEGDVETAIPRLVSEAYGAVLELGPGIGSQLGRYDTSKVSKIFGVEPNTDLHDALRASIKKAGLSDIYTIIPTGVENEKELAKYGIGRESLDTVLSVQVLCSVPAPEKMVRTLYSLLKPGGQMIVYEHVRSKDILSILFQDIYNTLWPLLIGNCHLNRPTGQFLMDAGNWESIQWEKVKDEDAWTVFPRISGRLVKLQKN